MHHEDVWEHETNPEVKLPNWSHCMTTKPSFNRNSFNTVTIELQPDHHDFFAWTMLGTSTSKLTSSRLSDYSFVKELVYRKSFRKHYLPLTCEPFHNLLVVNGEADINGDFPDVNGPTVPCSRIFGQKDQTIVLLLVFWRLCWIIFSFFSNRGMLICGIILKNAWNIWIRTPDA